MSGPVVIGPAHFDPVAEGIRDLRFGRIWLVTIEDDVREAVGDQLEATGTVLTPGERRPRSLPLTIPVRGSAADSDTYAWGDRYRRQLRSLIDNVTARLQGIYLWTWFDEELNGWLVVGGGELSYGDEGGPSLASYKLELSDCFKVANRHTHRQARRFEVSARAWPTNPRDYLGLVYSLAFSSVSLLNTVYLPDDAYDAVDDSGDPVALSPVPAAEGNVMLVNDVSNGTVIHFEQDEDDMYKDDVVALDRRGEIEPTFSLAGDLDPQNEYGWEEVYGPNYPFSGQDVPVLQNGRCRCRFIPPGFGGGQFAWILEAWEDGTGYVEKGRIEPRVLNNRCDQFYDGRLIEWTRERAVVKARMIEQGTGGVLDVYMTLQRGWRGPHFDVYARPTTNEPTLVYQPVVAGNKNFAYHIDGADQTIVGGTWNNTITWDGDSDDEPWATLVGQLAGQENTSVIFVVGDANLAVLREDASLYGSNRRGVRFRGSSGAGITAWLGLQVVLFATLPTATDALTHARRHMADIRTYSELVAR